MRLLPVSKKISAGGFCLYDSRARRPETDGVRLLDGSIGHQLGSDHAEPLALHPPFTQRHKLLMKFPRHI
jgi:hypothetical protein